jgi:hypothetical protein
MNLKPLYRVGSGRLPNVGTSRLQWLQRCVVAGVKANSPSLRIPLPHDVHVTEAIRSFNEGDRDGKWDRDSRTLHRLFVRNWGPGRFRTHWSRNFPLSRRPDRCSRRILERSQDLASGPTTRRLGC